MSQPQLDYALPRRPRSRFMIAALLFVRIHAGLALCISVLTFWLSACMVLLEFVSELRAGFNDFDDVVGAFGRMGYTVITPLALSAILFMGCEIYARRDADAAAR